MGWEQQRHSHHHRSLVPSALVPKTLMIVVAIVLALSSFATTVEAGQHGIRARSTSENTLGSRHMSLSFETDATNTETERHGRGGGVRWDGEIYIMKEKEHKGGRMRAPYSLEDDCNICRTWIQAAVAWLPIEFDPPVLQSVLRAACNDTWIIHAPALELVRVDYGQAKTEFLRTAPDNKGRCVEMMEADRNHEALFTMWAYWDKLQPIGALPDAVCCRLERCPCLQFGAHRNHIADKWYGPQGNVAPSYFP